MIFCPWIHPETFSAHCESYDMGRDGAAKGVAKREAVDAKPCSDRGLGTGDRAREVRDKKQQQEQEQ